MRAIVRKIKAVISDRKGATAVEYGLIMALMTVAVVGAITTTGSKNKAQWDNVAVKVGDAGS